MRVNYFIINHSTSCHIIVILSRLNRDLKYLCLQQMTQRISSIIMKLNSQKITPCKGYSKFHQSLWNSIRKSLPPIFSRAWLLCWWHKTFCRFLSQNLFEVIYHQVLKDRFQSLPIQAIRNAVITHKHVIIYDIWGHVSLKNSFTSFWLTQW